MKKLICFASVLMIFGLTSCNNELGPEYSTPAKVEGFTQSIEVFKEGQIVEIPADTPIDFSGRVTSTYGPVQTALIYAVCTLEDQAAYNLGEYNDSNLNAWLNYWQYNAKWVQPSKDKDTLVEMQAPIENTPFYLAVPGQPAGSVVYLQISISTPYLPTYSATVYRVAKEAENGGEGDDNGEAEPQEPIEQ